MVGSKPKIDEQALMKKVARERSHDAFSTLAEKYQKPAFALAYRITQQSDLAEEAVQEALLLMWRRASTFDLSKKLWPWFARIVAHASIKLYQRKYKNKAADLGDADTDHVSMERAKSSREGLSNLEYQEQSSLLGAALDRLPAHERQLLGLYYGAELSQYEISSALSIPQRKISHQLTHALESIRSALKKSGYVGALAIPNLTEAILTGPQPPSMLISTVLKEIDGTSVSPSSTKVTLITALLSIATLAGAIALSMTQDPRPSPQPPLSRETKTSPSPDTIHSKILDPVSPEISYHWNAMNGPPDDLELRYGSWKYDKNKVAMLTRRIGVVLLFPLKLTRQPFVLEIRGEGIAPAGKLASWAYGWSVRRVQEDVQLPFTIYREKDYLQNFRPATQAYFITWGKWQYGLQIIKPNPKVDALDLEHRLKYYLEDKSRYILDSVTEAGWEVPETFRLTVEFENMYVTELHLEPFDLNLLPPHLKDPEKSRTKNLVFNRRAEAQRIPKVK